MDWIMEGEREEEKFRINAQAVFGGGYALRGALLRIGRNERVIDCGIN